MLHTLVLIVHIIVAVFMILVVLLQGGNQGGVGAAFGGGNSSGVFGATGATSFFGKLTYGAAAIFMVTSISLTKMQAGSDESGVRERLRQRSAEKADAQAAQEGATVKSEGAETPAAPTSDAPSEPQAPDANKP